MKVFGKEIGKGRPPLYIAELSQNFANDAEGVALIEAAMEAGADVIKFQLLDPEELTIRCDKIDFQTEWTGQTYNIYDMYTPNFDMVKRLWSYCKSKNIHAFASVFGSSSLKVATDFGAEAIKISSYENNWQALIHAARSTGKKVFVSLGAGGVPDGDMADMVYLHCVSSYPTPLENANLRRIRQLSRFPYVGYSDHTVGYTAPPLAVALGACCIEKHITLSKDTIDSVFSLLPSEFSYMVAACNRAWEAVYNGVGSAEEHAQWFKRSIYVVEDMSAGDTFTHNNIRIIRPGHGATPDYYDRVIGMTAICSISRGTPLRMDMINV